MLLEANQPPPKGELTAKIIRARTGREGYDLIRDIPTANKAVQKFVTELCSDNTEKSRPNVINEYPVVKRISQQVQASAQSGISGNYFRGRWFPNEKTPSSDEFGPAPPESARIGRYNEGDQRVLYLGRTVETILAECPPSGENERLFIQKFELSISNAHYLRLTEDLEAEFPELHYLLLDSEFLADSAPFFAAYPYRATHFLAYLCRIWGITGVEYPSIRGDFKNNPEAVNLVLFGDAVDSACTMTGGVPEEYSRI